MDANKLMNQRNYIMKHKKITEMEVEEIKRELQESQRSNLEEREEEEELEHPGTTRGGEQKPDAASTTEEETEIHQQRNQIYKLKEKTESTFHQVTQIEIDKRPRLQKLKNVFKIEAIKQTANKAMGEILDGKDLNVTQLNRLVCAPAMLIQKKFMEQERMN